MQYQKGMGTELERYLVLSVTVFQAPGLYRGRSRFFEYRTAKARWGKSKQAEGYSSVKRNSDLELGRKETTIRSYRGGNWAKREE